MLLSYYVTTMFTTSGISSITMFYSIVYYVYIDTLVDKYL